MPSVRDNDKWICKACRTRFQMDIGRHDPCPNCGGRDHEQIAVTIVCDFCSAPGNVRWSYPCATFSDPDTNQGFIGAWAACQECHDLIQANDRAKLARRWREQDPDAGHLPEAVEIALILRLHNGFFAHRTGEPTPHREDDA